MFLTEFQLGVYNFDRKLAILDHNGILHILQLEVDGASFTLGSILS